MLQVLETIKKQLKLPAQILKLNNGLTVIHQHLPNSPVVVADVWVKAGVCAEPKNWDGIAHFLEHMIFKGSKEILPREFDQIIESSGGMTNAFTSHDYAHFFLTTKQEYISETFPFLADILLHAEIPDEEFYLERDVVLEEIYGCQDDVDWIAFQNLSQAIYKTHPYQRSILGDLEIVMQHTPNQMRCFHRTYYQPENMTVVLVGNIEQEKALSLVDRCFSEFSVPSECPPVMVDAEPPLINIYRSELSLPRIRQTRISMGWVGPGVEYLEDAFGLDLIAIILSGGRCSRLVRELREQKQLVLEISSDFSLQKDSSLFTISAWLETKDLSEVEAIISDRLHELQINLVTEEELQRAKKLVLNDYIFSTETPCQLAGLYGYYQTIAQAELSTIYPIAIANLEPEDIRRIANQYLAPERYAISIIKPC